MVREFLCEEEMFERTLHKSSFQVITGFNEILRSESPVTPLLLGRDEFTYTRSTSVK